MFKYLFKRDTTTNTYMNKTTSKTTRSPGPEYYDDYLYDDEYSQNSGAAETQPSQRHEVRSTRELEQDHVSTSKSIDNEESGDSANDQQKPTESSNKSSRGNRYLMEKRERDHSQRDTTPSYASSEELDGETNVGGSSIPNHTGSIEHEESTGDIFTDKEMDHYEKDVESRYGRSKEINANHGDIPHYMKGHDVDKEHTQRTEGYSSVEGDYHPGNMNQSGHSGGGVTFTYSHADSHEEEYYPKEVFFTSEEPYHHENRRRNPYHHYRRPYYYYPGYREPHYTRDVSEILRLVKEIHHRQNGRAHMRGVHNRRNDYRSLDRISRFPSQYG